MPERRVRFAAWAAARPLGLRLAAVAGGAALGLVAAAGLNAAVAAEAQHADALGAGLRAAWVLGTGGLLSGTAYAAVAPWLLAPERRRRWLSGLLVGLALVAGLLAPKMALASAAGGGLWWACVVALAPLHVVWAAWLIVPPAWSVARWREGAGAGASPGAG